MNIRRCFVSLYRGIFQIYELFVALSNEGGSLLHWLSVSILVIDYILSSFPDMQWNI